MERRAEAKENANRCRTCRTQCRESVSPTSERVRKAEASRQTSEVGAVCRKAARTVLCGGRPAMGVPTAIGEGPDASCVGSLSLRLFRLAGTNQRPLERLVVSRGTDGSNPVPSSGESGANARVALRVERNVFILKTQLLQRPHGSCGARHSGSVKFQHRIPASSSRRRSPRLGAAGPPGEPAQRRDRLTAAFAD